MGENGHLGELSSTSFQLSRNKKLLYKIWWFVAFLFLSGMSIHCEYFPKSLNFMDIETGMEFLFVKGGCFKMGDNSYPDVSIHDVCVDDYYIGKYEVTQGQWKKIMGNNPSYFKKGDNYPVEQVSWYDVQKFIQKLNYKTGKVYRLPTEAEWEYAARGRGENLKWAGTNQGYNLESYAWYLDNSSNQTHPVGMKAPNGLGLYDMCGNVREWCWDWYSGGDYDKNIVNNPKGPSDGSYKILRGGCWYSMYLGTRTSGRGGDCPTNVNEGNGFRLCMTP